MDEAPGGSYEIIVIGAGPAGLGAARTAARLGFRTLVIDRANQAGEMAHPCHAIMQWEGLGRDGVRSLNLTAIDLRIPEALVLTRSPLRLCLAPSGVPFGNPPSDGAPPAALLDMPGLLRMLARQAEAAGTSFAWGTEVIGLLRDGERVRGVRTAAGDVQAEVVIVAGGAGSRLAAEAGLAAAGRAEAMLVTVAQELDAPLATPDRLGTVTALGGTGRGYGALAMPSPGRAVMTYSVVCETPDCGLGPEMWESLGLLAEDPRLSPYLSRATVTCRSAYLTPIGQPPRAVSGPGVLLAGDAGTRAGHLGVLASIFTGRQAALAAADEVENDAECATACRAYDAFWRTQLLPALDEELRTLRSVLTLDDPQIERLAVLLTGLHLGLPFFQERQPASPATLEWLVAQVGVSAPDSGLLRQVLGDAADALPLPFFTLPARRASQAR